MRRTWAWIKAHRRFAILTAAAVGMMVVLAVVSPDLKDAQRAQALGPFDEGDLRLGAFLDYGYMVVYAAWFWSAFSFFPDPKHAGFRHPTATAGAWLAVGGALADAVENVFLLLASYRHDDGYLAVMRSAGLVKWALLGAAALALVSLVARRSAWNATPVGRPSDRPVPPPSASKVHPWEPPRKRAKARVGVCLSGGGIRSAAFCLGGMQALREKGKLDDARYLAAVSGGGYLAAGWAVSDAAPPADPPRWDPGSPEERWFRDHASYLIPDLKGGAAGLFRMLGGVVVNLLVIGLVLFAASRPVGWVMYELHPSLRATNPTVLIRDSHGDMQVGAITPLGSVDTDGAAAPIRRYAVSLVPKEGDAKANEACFDLPPYDPSGGRDACVNVRQLEGSPAVVEVQSGRAKVVVQPKVEAVDRDGIDASIRQQPSLKVKDDLVVDGHAPQPGQFELERQPKVGVKTGLGAVSYPTYPWWMWEVVGGLLAAAAVVGLAVMSFRLRDRRSDIIRAAARTLLAAGVVAFVVMIGLPWLVVWLPRTLASFAHQGTKSASGSGLQDYLLPSGGMLAVIAAAAGQYLAGSKGKTGAGAGDKTSWMSKVWGAMSKRSAELKWYELSPSKILVAVLSFVGVVVAFVNLLQFAAANGLYGNLMGFAFIRDSLPDRFFLHEWAKFGVVVGALALFAWLADAQAWSLYPFYKTRLSSAYLLQRTDPDHAEPIPFKLLLPFTGLKKPDDGPQLIACCSVNLSEYGVVPPGRRAASFTFSSTEIGGPLLGYAKPEDYEKLPLSRRRDVTVSSAMAISGAAFSPAMGKFNLGPVGTLLALANLRLGVWVPHPCRVRDGDPASEWDWWRFRRPHWWWYLREVTNKYAFHRRYVYVSDGGHWDNLGLVELLRRGCTEIYCISGAGDGATSFGTIGEAIALAREELGVEIDLDPSALRASTVAPTPATPLSPRELRREGAKGKAASFAWASAVKGTFRFTRSEGAAEGVIYYVEADVGDDMPFDVHTFAESEPVFPDDSTGDQVFGHRQFESYRALGYHQAVAACDLP